MLFIDSGAFLARYIQRDQHHQTARDAWHRLAAGHEHCYTSNFILDETFTLMARRAGYSFAAERVRIILSSEALTVLRPGKEDEREALDFFEKYADQEVSYTDCISFVLMKSTRIRRAFSFDGHFERAGFILWP